MNIAVKGLCKAFGEHTVLDELTAEFPEGRMTYITGPSGCGKTTLLRLLMRLEAPDAGEISGVPEKLAALFQEDRLCGEFSALTNVRIVGATEDRAREHLAALGLGDSLEKPVSQLSGGQRRRAALCRAMLADADAVFLDEPFTGLDPELRTLTAEYIRTAAAGRTVLLVTHDLVAPEGAYIFEMK